MLGGGLQKQVELWVRKLGMSRPKRVKKLAFTQDEETLPAVDEELGYGSE